MARILSSCIRLSFAPADRAKISEDSEEIESAYRTAALQSDSEVPKNAEDEVDLHYVLYTGENILSSRVMSIIQNLSRNALFRCRDKQIVVAPSVDFHSNGFVSCTTVGRWIPLSVPSGEQRRLLVLPLSLIGLRPAVP